ncbi:carboxymuconolactone decarboxylase family protein [Candidimonas sp. SYP-B2681]|uniref:carboxymuconolactone decarboxylase family protein n=1 Tax=Candidimonas sp. SYP-B2681 TaxID=2497686 RepID=UPI000F864D2A|nr:carboxymuconolactone decarboxylase family protein [Candidimonas sp. SYP-B2681]RTZ45507.1 carboxymuconolactone decarboxylase family protein [Candidimonas sp. SYP-B2681]
MSTDHIRVPLVVPGTAPELADIEAKILSERGRISLLYQVLLNSKPIAQGWEAMLTAVRNQTAIDPAIREMVILRVAVLNKAEFEFDAHIPHAVKAGLSDAKIYGLREAQPEHGYTDEERLVIELTDRMTRDVAVPEALMKKVREVYGVKETVELVATVAAYNMVSRFLVALNISH